MRIFTPIVHPDEPCYGLWEGEENGRWLQKIFVVRGDAIARYMKDYGPASDYERVMPIIIPNDGDDSVAALQYLAEKNRHDDYWAKRREEMLASSTLISDVMTGIDKKREKGSKFGPFANIQRS